MCLATFAIAHFLSFLFSPLRWPAPALRPLLPAFPFPPITGTAAGEGGRTCFQICSVSAFLQCIFILPVSWPVTNFLQGITPTSIYSPLV